MFVYFVYCKLLNIIVMIAEGRTALKKTRKTTSRKKKEKDFRFRERERVSEKGGRAKHRERARQRKRERGEDVASGKERWQFGREKTPVFIVFVKYYCSDFILTIVFFLFVFCWFLPWFGVWKCVCVSACFECNAIFCLVLSVLYNFH